MHPKFSSQQIWDSSFSERSVTCKGPLHETALSSVFVHFEEDEKGKCCGAGKEHLKKRIIVAPDINRNKFSLTLQNVRWLLSSAWLCGHDTQLKCWGSMYTQILHLWQTLTIWTHLSQTVMKLYFPQRRCKRQDGHTDTYSLKEYVSACPYRETVHQLNVSVMLTMFRTYIAVQDQDIATDITGKTFLSSACILLVHLCI